MAKLPWILFTITVTLGFSEAYKILVVFPFPGKSHSILAEGFVRPLLQAGHEVTYITPFPKKDPHPDLHQIDVSANLDVFSSEMLNLTRILTGEKTNDLNEFFNIVLNLSKVTFNNPNVQKLLNDPNQKFNLIIIEWMFSELYAGLSAVFDCPYIWFSSVEPHWMVLTLIDEALPPAYNANALADYIPPFTFQQRVQELFGQIAFTLIRKFYLLPLENAAYEKIFSPLMEKKGKPLPSFEETRHNASIMLGNSHVSTGLATRLPQSYKAIGGYHIDTNVKPLPEDLQRLMDNAKYGVIYFSMGSNFKSKDLPDEIKKDLLKVFGGLKQNVIWKFEEELPDLPKNVRILKWAPQPSILAHPNCVLFITHGGLLSTTETIHFGVPIIGIPGLADQASNVMKAVKKGFAKKVDLSYHMADDLKVAIQEILSDSSYRKKVKELSFIYHDRPATPAKELVHWSEHVIRTGGAPHLRSPALMVPWYQKMYIDLLLLIVAVLLVLKIAFRRLFCSQKKEERKEDKKKKN